MAKRYPFLAMTFIALQILYATLRILNGLKGAFLSNLLTISTLRIKAFVLSTKVQNENLRPTDMITLILIISGLLCFGLFFKTIDYFEKL